MKTKRYLSPEPEDAAAAAPVEAAPPPTPASAAAPVEEPELPEIEDIPATGEFGSWNDIDDDDETAAPVKPADEKKEEAKPEEKKPEEEKPADTTTDEEEESLVSNLFEEEIGTGDESAETENSWKDVSKDLGLEIEEDSYEAFTEAVKKKIEAAEKPPVVFEKEYGEEAVKLAKALSTGLKLEQIQAPLLEFDNALIMTPEQKVKQLLINEGKLTTQAQIDEEYDAMLLRDEVDPLVEKIDKYLHQRRKEVYDKIITEANTKVEVSKQDESKNQEQFNNAVVAELAKQEKYMEEKLTATDKAAIEKKLKAGVYQKVLSKRPDVFLKAVLDLEMREVAVKRMLSRIAKDGKSEMFDQLANLETAKKSTRGAGAGADTKPRDVSTNFGSWANVDNDAIEGVKRE